MKDNLLKKKIKILYVVVIGLIILLLGIFFYFNKKYSDLNKIVMDNVQSDIYELKYLQKIVELNHLDTENAKYYVNPTNWQEQYKKENGMNLDIPKEWRIDSIVIRRMADSFGEYTIILNKIGSVTFDDFARDLYNKMYDFAGLVESFKEGKGYYEIRSFNEATYNNMYYDYMTRDSEGVLSGPKIKVKLINLEETNQVKIEVNKF